MVTEGKARCEVVVGKSNPPHLEHLYLIERGAARVERLFVVLCDRPDQPIPVGQGWAVLMGAEHVMVDRGRSVFSVSGTALPMRAVVLAAGAVATVALRWVLDAGWDDALCTYWDASIVAASVLAMVLLSRKKVESWWLWIGPVNVSAIGLYVSTGAYMFAALYVLFLVMAFVGLARWLCVDKNGVA